MAEIVIAGFGSAGYAAMSAIRRADASARITVIDPKQSDLFHPCGLPYALEGRADEAALQQNIALDRAGVTRIRARAVRLNNSAHLVICDNGQLVRYDRLIIAQGSTPLIPPIPGIDEVYGAGLHTLASPVDLERLRQCGVPGAQAVVVGAGAIGLETAAALAHRGMQVTVFEMREEVLPGALDTDVAIAVREHLAARGLVIRTGCGVDEIMHEQGRFSGVRSGGTVYNAELGVMAAGSDPICAWPRRAVLNAGGWESMLTGACVRQWMMCMQPGLRGIAQPD